MDLCHELPAGVSFLLLHLGPGDTTQAVRLGSSRLYPLSHLAVPHLSFLLIRAFDNLTDCFTIYTTLLPTASSHPAEAVCPLFPARSIPFSVSFWENSILWTWHERGKVVCASLCLTYVPHTLFPRFVHVVLHYRILSVQWLSNIPFCKCAMFP